MSRRRNPLIGTLVDYIMRGGEPKEFAITHGHAATWGHKALSRRGIKKHWLTIEEHKLIIEHRRVAASPARTQIAA